uniref:Uncharacterized protein n=1 Tax=Yersinia pseudotuberculosis serotype O:3 (strain YPIII) TaxID=502800 RepID=A0A0H3B236_YERPY
MYVLPAVLFSATAAEFTPLAPSMMSTETYS